MLHRRKFIQTLGLLPLIPFKGLDEEQLVFQNKHAFKISLNAYSFNSLLNNHTITLEELISYTAETKFDAIDLTGYYFPDYPKVASDKYIYHIKNLIHKNGLDISGTGIRTDFTDPNQSNRNSQIALVKEWVDFAAKLGAPVLRIFTGKKIPENYRWEEVAKWIVEDFKVCIDYSAQKGVILGLQNHNDFIQTADQALYFVDQLDKDWFGLIVDIGSFVKNNVYEEISKVVNHGVNWQLKELVTINNKSEPVDLLKIKQILEKSSYKGYLPIETLSQGDPRKIVAEFYARVKAVF